MEDKIQTDFLIVGGGTAGCILAARLSENPSISVCVLEAGARPRGEKFRVPAGMSTILEKPPHDWCYMMQPDPTANNRRLTWCAGKVLGGSSSLNGMVYVRGHANDYDTWDEINGGNSGWAYADMEPFFQRAERFVDRSAPQLGSAGPMGIGSIKKRNPLADKFILAGTEMGYDEIDLNRGAVLGFGAGDASVCKGRRSSTYECYLAPIIRRPNLRVVTNAMVQSLITEGESVLGAKALVDGRDIEVRAGMETIVSSGAIGSPALLLRSGIGPSNELAHADIPVVNDLPGVGRNLQEHIGCGIAKYVDVTTINSQMGPLAGIGHVFEYYTRKTGLLASPVVQSMAYIKTLPDLKFPDVQLGIVPYGYIMGPESTSALTAYTPKRDSVMISGFVCKPRSRGAVKLSGDSVNDVPIIDYRFFREQEDLETLVRSCKIIAELYEQESLKPHVTGECTLDRPIKTDEDWKEYIRGKANVCYHFSGTCAMGTSDSAVVDASLKVRGMENLRVVDASIMPVITTGNTHAPVIAIAEKAADLIRENW